MKEYNCSEATVIVTSACGNLQALIFPSLSCKPAHARPGQRDKGRCPFLGLCPAAFSVLASTGTKQLVPPRWACLWYLSFTKDKNRQELWNSAEGQNSNLFAWSNFLLYSDIWHPLQKQIRALPSSAEEGNFLFPDSTAVSVNTGIQAQKQCNHRKRLVSLVVET